MKTVRIAAAQTVEFREDIEAALHCLADVAGRAESEDASLIQEILRRASLSKLNGAVPVLIAMGSKAISATIQVCSFGNECLLVWPVQWASVASKPSTVRAGDPGIARVSMNRTRLTRRRASTQKLARRRIRATMSGSAGHDLAEHQREPLVDLEVLDAIPPDV
jgi:hypothetical protein